MVIRLRRGRRALGPGGYGSGYRGSNTGRTRWGPVASRPAVYGVQRPATAPRRGLRPHAREDRADHGGEQWPGPRHRGRAVAPGGSSDHGLPGPRARRGGGGSLRREVCPAGGPDSGPNSGGAGELVVKELDLASLSSVRSFCQEMLQEEPRLDVLINNAGSSSALI
ncbi:unnamed protein product [Rangifer tarandus platyrhynchus]|uniref:Uncharacterized protein n=1 Tax=Rangifer tarandus platyrhynchus TaxID=3082113 RepID=A0AC60A6H1_RANTA